MSWEVIQVPPDRWVAEFSEHAHAAVFNEVKASATDRLSYALLVTKNKEVIGYVTVREIDDKNVYWQFGGVLAKFRRTFTAAKCIETAIEWQRQHSERIVTYVENNNLPMLRFYLAYGFLIIGTRTFQGHTMVDMMKEFT